MSSDTPPAAASESAETLLASLRQLDRDGRVEIRIDPRPLGHIDSPVAFEADGNVWVYGSVALAGALLLWRGVVPALAALAIGIALYLSIGRVYVNRRIRQRVRTTALASAETWRKVWRFRGLTLIAKDRPDLAACSSPDGNWMAFVRAFN
ncbi:MAG TPA: hypothetical protein VE397_17770 [Stellaceae bacterium]|jgi:hypothetical protein|nr:hypothetical protein [Stellaceae bacterium]